jgi:hypothetical protein
MIPLTTLNMEHGRHAADAERDHDDGQRAEGPLLDEHAESDAKVADEGLWGHGGQSRNRMDGPG